MTWLDDEPSSVAASSPTSSHQTFFSVHDAAAVNAVGGGVADDHVLQRAAVRDLEHRGLALVLAAAAQRARPGEALHAAVVGAADVDRRADRLAAVRGRPVAEVRRRAAAAARGAAAAARGAAAPVRRCRRAAAPVVPPRPPAVPPRRSCRRARRAAPPVRRRAAAPRALPPVPGRCRHARPQRPPVPVATVAARRPRFRSPSSRPRRSCPAVALVPALPVVSRRCPSSPSRRRRRAGARSPALPVAPLLPAAPDGFGSTASPVAHAQPAVARINKETTEAAHAAAGAKAHDTMPPGGCSGQCRRAARSITRSSVAEMLPARHLDPPPHLFHDAPQPGVRRRRARPLVPDHVDVRGLEGERHLEELQRQGLAARPRRRSRSARRRSPSPRGSAAPAGSATRAGRRCA